MKTNLFTNGITFIHTIFSAREQLIYKIFDISLVVYRRKKKKKKETYIGFCTIYSMMKMFLSFSLKIFPDHIIDVQYSHTLENTRT